MPTMPPFKNQVSPDVQDALRAIWQAPLTEEDCREVIANVSGVFGLLSRWAEQDALLDDKP